MAALALLGGLLLARSIPGAVVFALRPPALSPSGTIEFVLTPWSWALLVSVLGFGLCQALTSTMGKAQASQSRSAGMVFSALIALSTMAATYLTLVLTWTLVICAQTWIHTTQLAPEEASAPWRLVRARDFATLLFLAGAFGLGGFGTAATQVSYAFLVTAGFLRVSSALWAPDVPGGLTASVVPGLGFPTAVSVLAALSWGLGSDGAQALAPWLIASGAVMLVIGCASQGMAESPDDRARSWVVGIGGTALLAAAVFPQEARPALAVSALLLVIGGTVGMALPLGHTGARVGAAVAGLATAGTPGLIGAVLLGILLPDGNATAVGWVVLLGLALLASRYLQEAIRPSRSAPLEAVPVVASLAATVVVLLGALLYIRLRPLVAGPLPMAAPVALGIAIAGAWVLARVPAGQRQRIARSFRWPASLSPRRLLAPLIQEVEALVRGTRDVLEGDASLLWAFVVVIVALLLVQGAR